jgi:type II secretory pathway component GspD/PulD (secretin)
MIRRNTVLFNPSGRRSDSKMTSIQRAKHRESETNSMLRRKRIACLGLAASMVLPQTAALRSLWADQTGSSGTAARASDADLLKHGIAQYNSGQYEQAVATLGQVDAKALSDEQRQALATMIGKADAAANDREAARVEFARGELARKADRLADAIAHYQAALSNPRIDQDTQRAAQDQLDLIDAGQKLAQGEGKAAYNRGVEEYKKAQWVQARTDFIKAQELGFTGGFAQASPADYLKQIDKRQGPSGASPDQNGAARQVYERGRQEYRAKQWDAARRDFAAARDAGFVPGFLEGLTPAEYLSRIDEMQAAQARSAQQGAANPSSGTGSFSTSTTTVNLANTTGPTDQQALQHQAELDQIAEQQRVYKAAGLVDLGKKAEQAGNDQEALRDYSDAVDLDPTNSNAVQGRDRVRSKLGIAAPAPGANLNVRAEQLSAAQQAITYKFNAALSKAHADVASRDFAAANDDVAQAEQARDEDPTIFNEAQLRSFDAGIERSKTELADAQRRDQEERQRTAAMEAVNAETNRLRGEAGRRQAAIQALIKLSRTQIDQQNYAAALGVIDQILTLDPQNDYALGVRQFVEDKAILQDQRKYRVLLDSNLARQLNRAEEAQVPYEDVYRFPENWPDITEMRDSENKNSNVSKEDQAIQAMLDHRLPAVNLQGQALTDAVEFLKDVTGANILVNWKALETDSIDKQTPVTAVLHDVKFSKVLDVILQQAGAGKLSYTINEGVIEISTTEELNKAVETRVYDIDDLLLNNQFEPLMLTDTFLSQGGPQVMGGTGGNASSPTIFSGTTGTGGTSPVQAAQQQVADLKKKIESTVDPGTWKDNDPNGFGQIDDYNNHLIITQTNEVHAKVANLLQQLREAQAVQVAVEVRFLTVARNFMEDIGVNLGLTFNNNSSFPNPPSHYSPITITNGSSAFTSGPDTGLPGSIGTTATGLNVGASYGNLLDDLQVSLMIRATEASRRTSVVHAPRVTLQSGQEALMYEETFTPYVGSLNVTAAAGAAIATPVISVARDGVILTIYRAVVSGDHKYVTLDIAPELDTLLGFTTFQFEQAAPITTTTSVGGVAVGTGFVAPTLTIQEPTEEVTRVVTRATIPDGGTLMLGGNTIAGEINLEAGVPGLSKIPFIKRLFTNASNANDEQVLIILVKPTILLNKEIEAKMFPLLSSGTQ